MDLSSEDSLRLNVLIANSIAVRINEGAMSVYGLSETGKEARVELNPTCGSDRYIRYVRELLSSTILGSPGGYPVFLKRWTRMGQAKDTRLADLLMLGESEAVVAVSCAAGLTDELARCVWWVMPDAENARRMLSCEGVVKGSMGKVLANFLLEFLPFEQEPATLIESVRLVLQPELLEKSSYISIWNRGKQKSVFLVGFLQALPDDLPEPLPERSDSVQYRTLLGYLAKSNPFALQLLRILSIEGQTFIHVCKRVLIKPNNQDVVVELLDAITRYFSNVRILSLDYEDVESIINDVHDIGTNKKNEDTPMQQQLSELLKAVPELHKEINAMLVLAHTGECVVSPIFQEQMPSAA